MNRGLRSKPATALLPLPSKLCCLNWELCQASEEAYLQRLALSGYVKVGSCAHGSGEEDVMPLPPIADDLCTVVITGDMRPVKVSPDWLRAQRIISDADSREEKFELLVPNEAAIFRLGPVKYQISARGLQLETSDESEFEPMRDLVVDILTAMPKQEVSQLGINRVVHFSVPNIEAWHSVGDTLVNNSLWDGVLNLSGMRSVTYWGVRPDRYGGRIQVQIEPSFRYPSAVFVAYNDHYELTRVTSQPQDRDELARAVPDNVAQSTEKISIAIEILNEAWNESTRRFYDVLERLWQITEKANG